MIKLVTTYEDVYFSYGWEVNGLPYIVSMKLRCDEMKNRVSDKHESVNSTKLVIDLHWSFRNHVEFEICSLYVSNTANQIRASKLVDTHECKPETKICNLVQRRILI